jgi:hypothetical protein
MDRWNLPVRRGMMYAGKWRQEGELQTLGGRREGLRPHAMFSLIRYTDGILQSNFDIISVNVESSTLLSYCIASAYN